MVYSKEISTKITVDKLPKIIIIYSGYVKLQEWWNWQTRTFEGRMAIALRVQIPSPAPLRNKNM